MDQKKQDRWQSLRDFLQSGQIHYQAGFDPLADQAAWFNQQQSQVWAEGYHNAPHNAYKASTECVCESQVVDPRKTPDSGPRGTEPRCGRCCMPITKRWNIGLAVPA